MKDPGKKDAILKSPPKAAPSPLVPFHKTPSSVLPQVSRERLAPGARPTLLQWYIIHGTVFFKSGLSALPACHQLLTAGPGQSPHRGWPRALRPGGISPAGRRLLVAEVGGSGSYIGTERKRGGAACPASLQHHGHGHGHGQGQHPESFTCIQLVISTAHLQKSTKINRALACDLCFSFFVL